MNELKSRAVESDKRDELATFRDSFHFPHTEAGHCIYLTGNSLGLQPKEAADILREELEDWARFGVEGHFHSRRPWVNYHEYLMDAGAEIVGAKPGEVVHMNGLTTNIHLLMVSFYRPTPARHKIICEAKAFPSDQYALDSQIRFHGFSPESSLVELAPRPGEHTLRDEDIVHHLVEGGVLDAADLIGGELATSLRPRLVVQLLVRVLVVLIDDGLAVHPTELACLQARALSGDVHPPFEDHQADECEGDDDHDDLRVLPQILHHVRVRLQLVVGLAPDRILCRLNGAETVKSI